MKLPLSKWPILAKVSVKNLPETIQNANIMSVSTGPRETLAHRIQIDRHSSFQKIIRVTARVLALYNRENLSLKNVGKHLTKIELKEAEVFWVREAQRKLGSLTQYKRLGPRIRNDGVVVVGSRLVKETDKYEVPLIPHTHRVATLYCDYVHGLGHNGVATTVCKVRAKYWITNIHRIVKKIRFNCTKCKKIDRIAEKQVMGRLPTPRLQPSAPFMFVSCDLFGPMTIRGEINKRSQGKCFGIIFTCMATRAVSLDITSNYSSQALMMAIRRFIAIRGSPREIFSDLGSQLVGVRNYLKKVSSEEDGNIKWHFHPSDAPWYNGCSEALIKSVKRTLLCVIGDQIMTFSELQTVMVEVSNILNNRPIGKHPQHPEDGIYLCPNELLLGRSGYTSFEGPFDIHARNQLRFEFIQRIVDSFWKRWIKLYFPSLIVHPKWHTRKRNLRVGDVVAIQDANALDKRTIQTRQSNKSV